MASATLPHAFTETWRPPTEPQTSADATGVWGDAVRPSIISDTQIARAVFMSGAYRRRKG